MGQFQFNFTDIFRVSRYGFSGRRIGIHLVGILLAYLIYEILVYLSLFLTGGSAVTKFWDSYGILPVTPFISADLNPLTTWTMWFGILIFGCIFYLTSTMASKITIEQMRGEKFFSIGNALGFLRHRWLTVFGSFLWILAFMFLLLLIPVCVGLLGKIPFVGTPILIISSLFTPVAFLIGLFTAYIATVFIFSLFYVPAVVATTGADAFETVYQLFSVVWNEPWRLIGYGSVLILLQLMLVPIWAVFCVVGFLIVLLVTHALHTQYIEGSLAIANEWLGGTLQKLVGLFSQDSAFIFTSQLPSTTVSMTVMTVCAIFITFTLVFLVGGIIAYFFSLESVGTTIIYTILRKQTDGQNLIQIIGSDDHDILLEQHTGNI